MHLVGYIRTSRDFQTSDDAQKAEIVRYCEYNKHTVVSWCYDKKSGKDTKREGLQEALATLGNGADGLVVYSLSRLSRSVTDTDSMVKRYFTTSYSLHSVVDKIDTSTASGRVFLNMLAVFSQFERENTQERTLSGIRQRKESGKTYCKRLYGFNTASETAMTVHHTEQEVIQKIQEMRPTHSLQQIADWLNSNSIPSPEGKQWHKPAVSRMVKRTTQH